MYKKALIVVFALVGVMIGCSVKTDHWYSGNEPISIKHINTDPVVQMAGCSAVCIANKNEKSYFATAKHCKKFAKSIKVSGRETPIERIWCDNERDVCIFEISGKSTTVIKLLDDKPNNQHDVCIGYVYGELTTKFGEAIPGMSGGGVFTEEGYLWGVVSTTGEGTSIVPAIKRMGLTWILEKN